MKREPNDHVGPALEDRLDQPRVLGRVVLQVGVLHDDDVAGAVLEALAQRRALAQVLRLVEDADVVVLLLESARGCRGAVGRAVVDEDDLLRDRTAWTRRTSSRQPALLVVDGDDDRQLEAGRDRVDAESAGRRARRAVSRSTSTRAVAGPRRRRSTRSRQVVGMCRCARSGLLHVPRLRGRHIRHHSLVILAAQTHRTRAAQTLAQSGASVRAGAQSQPQVRLDTLTPLA